MRVINAQTRDTKHARHATAWRKSRFVIMYAGYLMYMWVIYIILNCIWPVWCEGFLKIAARLTPKTFTTCVTILCRCRAGVQPLTAGAARYLSFPAVYAPVIKELEPKLCKIFNLND